MSFSRPKISVIMAVYNGMTLGPQSRVHRGMRTASSAYLREAVKSILAQTYKNFEFIIVDDASTDGSLKYLKGLRDKRIKLIKNKKNLGLAASLNRALRLAQGDYVARMDADDISLPNRLEDQARFLLSHPNIDLCGTWVKIIDEKGKVIGKLHKPTSDKAIKRLINWQTPILHPTWMAKKALFENLHGYNPNYDFVEDYEFLLRAKEFKMANVAKELLLWRIHPSRRSRKELQKMYEMDFKVKLNYFKNGKLGISFLPLLIYKFLTAYVIPSNFKLFIIRKTKLA